MTLDFLVFNGKGECTFHKKYASKYPKKVKRRVSKINFKKAHLTTLQRLKTGSYGSQYTIDKWTYSPWTRTQPKENAKVWN